jgi:very-short-patch-repair endonuclease
MRTRDLVANNFHAARHLRQALTPTEQMLWERLRNRRLDGWKFRQQHPIGRFVLEASRADLLSHMHPEPTP